MRAVEAAQQQGELLRLRVEVLFSRVHHVLADVALEHEAARLCIDELATDLRRDDLGHVLVFGDRGDFRVGEIAEVDAILQGQHPGFLTLATSSLDVFTLRFSRALIPERIIRLYAIGIQENLANLYMREEFARGIDPAEMEIHRGGPMLAETKKSVATVRFLRAQKHVVAV
ncbi:MAG TPA: hypothetical protein VFJ68_08420 [Casimicrobiaceae bacterium]|nr:hypothetical protein [Casimicrobiaceae bacterium]